MEDSSKDIKRKTLFIESSTGSAYLPRPDNWISGWMRHIWFEHRMKKKPIIVSPKFWNTLSGKYDIKVLIEYLDHTFEVIFFESEGENK
tara:strand:+ start:1336 stop:1602 length:267 start_codon:yes stop_codon:yes gene_type:complete